MKRRNFIINCATIPLLAWKDVSGWAGSVSPIQEPHTGEAELSVGKAVNLAEFGQIQSWTNPQATPLLQQALTRDAEVVGKVSFDQQSWSGSQFDVGVEWPEFRTVSKVIIRFAAEDKVPRVGDAYLEYWAGLTTRQGEWKTLEEGKILGIPTKIDGRTWSYPFASLRTCKLRLLLQQNHKQVELESFQVYGPSLWRLGEVYIEWGHSQADKVYDGRIESYNGKILRVVPKGSTQMRGPLEWSSSASKEKLSGIVVGVLYTSGMDVDRTILSVRSQAGPFSFLPGEIVDDQPIDLPDFGVFIRNNAEDMSAAEFRRRNSKSFRIVDAVARLPEQTLDNASRHIHAMRVWLSFIGVDSNNQKFGVAPDGHLVVGNNDPSSGKPMEAKFGVFFDSAQSPELFERPKDIGTSLFDDWRPKHQELEEGWLPIIITRWSKNDVSFERTDYAVLQQMPEDLDESKLRGDELALMISRLRIRNYSPLPQRTEYFVKPWKPAKGRMPYGPIPSNIENAWVTVVRDDCAFVVDENGEAAICYIDTHRRGSLSLGARSGTLRYSEVVKPGGEVSLELVVPGFPLPAPESAKLKGLDYDRLHGITVKYWKNLLAAGMNVELPDRHMQNIFNANLHHFLLALTKDATRGEHYPNTAMLGYGSIGSESSPVMQAMDMRGLHSRVESCLKAWLSTQGDSKPEGDYGSKEGGFYHFWPNYTSDQGGVLWALAEHFLYTRDKQWLQAVAKQIGDGCDFIIRERKRLMDRFRAEKKPLFYGLAPAGCVADMRDWEYSFTLNGYFYLGLKKAAMALQDVDRDKAKQIGAEAENYLQVIRNILKECVALSPVVRLRDNTGVPAVPAYVGLRGLSTDVKDSVDPDARHGYGYDSNIGPLHLLKSEVLEPDDPEVTWMLNYLEDRFFMFTPLPSRVDLDELSTDWFNLGGFEKLQPYYLHYQDAYLQRDQIPNFLRGFFNTMLTIADPMTLTFQEDLEADITAGEPHKTHEEGWFFHQFRSMLVMEINDQLFLARATPREWLRHGQRIVVKKAATHFGETSYSIQSRANEGQLEARVDAPNRQDPAKTYLRLRHPEKAAMKRVQINGHEWRQFNASKEWIELPRGTKEVTVVAEY